MMDQNSLKKTRHTWPESKKPKSLGLEAKWLGTLGLEARLMCWIFFLKKRIDDIFLPIKKEKRDG